MLQSFQVQPGSAQPHQHSTRPVKSTNTIVATTDLSKAKCMHVQEHIQEVSLEENFVCTSKKYRYRCRIRAWNIGQTPVTKQERWNKLSRKTTCSRLEEKDERLRVSSGQSKQKRRECLPGKEGIKQKIRQGLDRLTSVRRLKHTKVAKMGIMGRGETGIKADSTQSRVMDWRRDKLTRDKAKGLVCSMGLPDNCVLWQLTVVPLN